MKKAIIILATYNGEKYLKELLDSLYAQTYENITIYTRDDGSKDNTCKIVEEYSKKKVKGKKMVIVPNGGENWRCPDCFVKLLEGVKEGDYFFFADQDDYWDKDKIKNAINKMEKVDSKIPTLHFGAYDNCDSELNFVSHSTKLPNVVKLRNVIYDYWPLGFNIGFNKALYDLVFTRRPKRIYYHDCFFAQVALGCGKFLYSPEPSVKYRRQEGAVTYSNHSKFSLFFWRIKRFFGENKSNLVQLRDILAEYKKLYSDLLSKEDNKLLDIFTRKSFGNYFKKIFYPHRLRLKIVDEISLRVLFIFNML
jgi:rhamnosyltransferase